VKDQQKQHARQRPLAALPKEQWDVIIIGAGPAGSTAAVHLASQGHHVLLVDKENFPREKVCGDGLITDALNCLERMELRERVESIGYQSKVATIFSRSRIKYEFSVEPFITIRRKILDSLMAEKAVESGAMFARGKITGITTEPDGSTTCSFYGSDKLLRTKVVVMAIGANVELPKRIGMVQVPKATHVAARCYIRSSVRIDCPVISYDKSVLPGCAWIFPLGSGEHNIGCCVSCQNILRRHMNIKKTFNNFISDFPLARHVVDHTERMTPLKGGVLCTGLKGVMPYSESRNLLAIGETIGTTLPLSGEGIGKAMESGELAAEVIDEAFRSEQLMQLRRFPTLVEEKLKPRYPSYAAAERWLTKFWLNDLIAVCLKRSKKLRNALAGVLQETTDPAAVFSLHGVVKSIWA
jgi:geranylgeranyl reductase family protein